MTSEKYCIIGAGPSGLTVAKNFHQRKIPFDLLEQAKDLGGNWNINNPNSSVYESTHLISSKRMTEYTDFPMPKEFPPYPGHQQVLSYLRDYVREFQLEEQITFEKRVTSAVPINDSGWEIQLEDEVSPRTYRGLVIANGHHWDPKVPTFKGNFQGEIIHSHDYKSPEILKGKRVLVIGAGNSGCDIAVESASNADGTFISMRRGYHFLPKFLHGRPIDLCGEQMHRWRLPLFLQRWISSIMVKIAIGRPQKYGLPAPDHKLFETHPIVNSQLLYFVGHGEIKYRPDVIELSADEVLFADNRKEKIDLIICATGYHISIPFLQKLSVFNEEGYPQLFLNVFHPERDDLFIAGLIQPNSGQWGLTDLQAQLISSYIVSQSHTTEKGKWFEKLKRAGWSSMTGGIEMKHSERHLLEVEYYSYREKIKSLVKKFGSESQLNYPCSPVHLPS